MGGEVEHSDDPFTVGKPQSTVRWLVPAIGQQADTWL